jgi:hypothetical protein
MVRPQGPVSRASSHRYAREPVYVRRFFTLELGFAETAVVFNLADLVHLGTACG